MNSHHINHHTTSAAATMRSCVTSIKVSHQGDIRRFPASTSLTQLLSQLAASYGVDEKRIVLRYVDDENDTVTIHSDPELFAAQQGQSGSVLRCQLDLKDADESSNNSTPPTTSTPTPTVDDTARHGIAFHYGAPFGAPFGRHFGRHGFPHGGPHHGPRHGFPHGGPHHGFPHDGPHHGFPFGGPCHSFDASQPEAPFAHPHPHQGYHGHGHGHSGNWNELREKWATQLQEFKTLGLPAGPFAMKMLEEHEGNMDACRKAFEERNKEREQRFEALRLKYAPQMEELRNMGYTSEPVCMRLLMKFDGDVQRVVERMKSPKGCRGAWAKFFSARCAAADTDAASPKPQQEEEEKKEEQREVVVATPQAAPVEVAAPQAIKWAAEHVALAAMGFESVDNALLDAHNGDLNAVVAHLLE